MPWLYSFLPRDRRKASCLAVAAGPGAIRRAAVRARLPAGTVVEIRATVLPYGFAEPV